VRRACRAIALALLVSTISAPAAVAADSPSLEHARQLYDAGNLDDARRELEALVRSGAEDPQVFLLLGVIDRTAGRFGSAVTSLERARGLALDATPMAVELATTLAWSRELDRAIALFHEVLTAEPANTGARVGLGFALAWQGHLDEARTTFEALTRDEPRNGSAWSGLGFVERAALRRTAAEAAYRRALEIEPGDAEATDALEQLRWDNRSETRVLAGLSSSPGVPERGEARIETVYALSPRVTLAGAYQRYAFGAVLPVASGGSLVSTRREDSLEAGVTLRASTRTLLAASLYTFAGDGVKRGAVWVEGAYALTPRLSLVGSVRPAFSTSDPKSLWGGGPGAAVSFAGQQVTVRTFFAANTRYEPRLTVLAGYDFALSRRFRARVGGAHSSTDPRFEFTSVTAGATWLLTPSLGFSAEATRRTGTSARSTFLVGVILRQ
jgi:cytochrome c-type biogenesis protein CcmH/NrfG